MLIFNILGIFHNFDLHMLQIYKYFRNNLFECFLMFF